MRAAAVQLTATADRDRNLEHAEDEAEDGRRRDPGHERAARPARGEHDGDEQAAERDERRARREVAEADPGRRVVDDDAALAQPDERDEERDPDADGELELERHRADDRLAQPREHEDEGDRALEHDAGHRHGPLHALALHEVERHDRVQAQAGRKGEREVRREAHDRREERGGQRGGHGDGLERQPGGGEDRRVDEDDVRHRQERRGAPEHLRARRAAPLGEAEPAVEGAHGGHGARTYMPCRSPSPRGASSCGRSRRPT
jgi:hypothetical protein